MKKFHPEIENTDLTVEEKKILQTLLEKEFGNNIHLLFRDVEKFLADEEDYELAAKIRDYNKALKDGSNKKDS